MAWLALVSTHSLTQHGTPHPAGLVATRTTGRLQVDITRKQAGRHHLDMGCVGRKGQGRLTIHKMPLLVQPALGRLVPPLQHHVVALQPAREVVPRRRDERVLALEGLDGLVRCGLVFLAFVLDVTILGLGSVYGVVECGRGVKG